MEVPGVGAFLLVHVEDLQARAVGQQVGQMDGVAMSEAHAVEQPAVVVAGRRAPDDLVLAVAVDIGDGEVVVAVAIERARAAGRLAGCGGEGGLLSRVALLREAGIGDAVGRLRVGAVQPAVAQPLVLIVDGPDVGTGVVAAAEDAAGRARPLVQMGHGGQETVTAVAVVVAPEVSVGGVIVGLTVVACAVGVIPDGVLGSAGESVEDGQVLGAAEDHALRLTVAGGDIGSGVVGPGDGRLGGGGRDVVALAVL